MNIDKKKILIFAVIVIIIVLAILAINKKKPEEVSENVTNVPDVLVQTLEDDTKLNTSSKLKETKKVGNIEISNIQVTNKNGKTTLLADVKNVGKEKIQMLELKITLIDTNGNEIGSLNGILGTIQVGETAQLNASSTKDFSNIYDIRIEYKN